MWGIFDIYSKVVDLHLEISYFFDRILNTNHVKSPKYSFEFSSSLAYKCFSGHEDFEISCGGQHLENLSTSLRRNDWVHLSSSSCIAVLQLL